MGYFKLTFQFAYLINKMSIDLNKYLLEFLQDDNQNSETETQSIQTAKQFKDIYQKAVDGPYEKFVDDLKGWAEDPKINQFLKSGLQDGQKSDDKFSVSSGSIACSHLIPTQNEIDLNKSLDYPLKNPDLITKYLQGKNIEIMFPIVTFNGRYIIDGHHRWSQVYCINPNATMKVINFKKANCSVEEMLKSIQVAIVATSGQIKTASVEGHNLLTISAEQIMKYVYQNMTDAIAKAFNKNKKDSAKQIALNCRQMQKNNKPPKGAPPRGFMPQTDEPKGNFSNVIKSLTSGDLQLMPPFIKSFNSTPVQQESKKLKTERMYIKNSLIETLCLKVTKKLQKAKVNEVKDSTVKDFVKTNYEDLEGLIDELTPEELRSEYMVFIRGENPKTLSEAIKTTLKEADDVEQADPVDMFQDFSGIAGQFADIYSTLVGYQTSYISNPKIKTAISQLMSGVTQLMKQSTMTMQVLGSSFGINEAKKLSKEAKSALKYLKNNSGK